MFLGIFKDTGFFTLLCVLGTPRCDLFVRYEAPFIVIKGLDFAWRRGKLTFSRRNQTVSRIRVWRHWHTPLHYKRATLPKGRAPTRLKAASQTCFLELSTWFSTHIHHMRDLNYHHWDRGPWLSTSTNWGVYTWTTLGWSWPNWGFSFIAGYLSDWNVFHFLVPVIALVVVLLLLWNFTHLQLTSSMGTINYKIRSGDHVVVTQPIRNTRSWHTTTIVSSTTLGFEEIWSTI